jgi:NAD(P)-dependent dehydrogenase (short-subunit alcohol dehydrogenase family)
VSAEAVRKSQTTGMAQYFDEDPKDMRETHLKLAHMAPDVGSRLRGWGTVALEVAPTLNTFLFAAGSIAGICLHGMPDGMLTAQVFAAFTAIQRFLGRGTPCPTEDARDMKGKVCLVTGASSGIGLVTAAKLLDQGATVIATHNSMSAEDTKEAILKMVMPDVREKLEGDNMNQFVVWPLRLEDRSSIARLANSVKKQYPNGLDVLVNNAGNMMGEDFELSNGLEKTIDVSFVGPYALTETLLMHLHKRDGRVVFLTSHQHRIVTARAEPHKIIHRTIGYRHTGDDDMRYHRSRQFSQAKFGNTCHAYALHNRGIKACAVSPGRTNTLLRRNVFPMLGTRYYWPGILWQLRTPEEGAQSVLHACLVKDEDFVSGGYYFNCKARPNGMSPFVAMAADAACEWAARESKVPVTRMSTRVPSKGTGGVKAATLKSKTPE